MTLAERIRDCRYAKGWGPDELAHRADISRTALYQIECGKTETPRAGTLRRIARALDVSIERLLGRGPEDSEAAAVVAVDEVFAVRGDPRGYARPELPTRDRFASVPGFQPSPDSP